MKIQLTEAGDSVAALKEKNVKFFLFKVFQKNLNLQGEIENLKTQLTESVGISSEIESKNVIILLFLYVTKKTERDRKFEASARGTR